MKNTKKILRCIIALIFIIGIVLALRLDKKAKEPFENKEPRHTLNGGYSKTLMRTEECGLNWDVNIFDVSAGDVIFIDGEIKRKGEGDITNEELDVALNCLTAQFAQNKTVNIADGGKLTEEQEKLIKDRGYYISYE